MVKTYIKLPDGTVIEISGSSEEVQRVLSLYLDKDKFDRSDVSTDVGAEVAPEVVTEPPKIQSALTWARGQLGRYVQPCGTPGCKYNPADKGALVCRTPNPRADDDDVKRENHECYHPFWNFYCMRFVRSAYGATADYAKAEDMYQALSRAGAIFTTNDIPVGALVFWHWSVYGHIGVYSGDGKVIHSGVNPNRKTVGIRESPLNEITDVLNGYNHYDKDGTRTSYLGWARPPEKWIK